MKTISGIILTCILLISCQKEINFDTPALPDQACKACSYYPVCPGSVYTFVDSISGISNEVTETIQGGNDTTIDGAVYKKVINGGLPTYVNCNAGVTSAIAYNIPTSVGTVSKVTITPIKANEPVGATWNDVLSNGLGQRVDYDYTMVAKGLTRTVLGVTYNDVIHINMVFSLTAPGVPTVVAGNNDYYYANNIGLIEVLGYTENFMGPPELIYHRQLKTYSIP